MSKKLKILIAWSGGKDSQASLIWSMSNPEWEGVEKEAVFCDTGWEHDLTYSKVKEVCELLKVKLTTVRSKKYEGFLDLALKKGRFPSTKARFCTEELKSKPMIDYILDECADYNLIIVQGIRKDESNARRKMDQSCTFFKYYIEPYGHDKKGKPKYHTHRGKEVLEFVKTNLHDVYRPVFHWTGQEVLNYIIENNQKPNLLYFHGMSRVGCMPCIMTNHYELKKISKEFPEVLEELEELEELASSTFFPPNYIPERYQEKLGEGKHRARVQDVKRYFSDKNATIEMFPEENDMRCMSYYSICE